MPDDQNVATNDAQRRIAQLVAQRKEAEESVASVQAEKDALQAQLLKLQDEVSALKAGSSVDPFGAPAQNYAGPTDVVKLLEDRFQKFEQKILDGERQKEARATLSYNQRESFQRAVTEFPEVTQDSQLFQAADQIMRSDPAIAHHPNGPFMAVLLAKGALAGSTASTTSVSPEAKAAATTGPSTGPVGDGNALPDEAKVLEQKVADLQNKMRAQQGDPSKLWTEYRNAKIELGKLTDPDNVGEEPHMGPR